jgi:hypothetical protein
MHMPALRHLKLYSPSKTPLAYDCCSCAILAVLRPAS